LEIQQLCNINKTKESVNVPKFEYFRKKYKDYENQSATTKIRHSKNAYKHLRFSRKIDADNPRQKSGTPRMLIITVVV